MSDGPDSPPFSTVDISSDNREDEDLFASAVQEVSLDPEMNGAADGLEKATIGNPPSITTTLSSPIMEEIATERANNIIITITDPQKIGEGMSSYVAYRVITKTNMPIFSKNELLVLRRFSDFLGLHEKLTEKYLRSGRVIPPAPEKSIVGTTKLKMTSTPSTESANGSSSSASVQSQFVERRRAGLERFLNRVAQHPVLCIDPDFREFLESDTELPKATSTSALSGAGVLRLFNKVGETVNKITYRMDESDPWFEERSSRIESLESCLRRLFVACEALSAERRELAARAHEAGRALSALAAADAHAPLCRALAHTADLHEKVHHTTHMYIQYHAVRAGGRRRACAALSRARAHRRPPREGTPHYTHVHTVSCCPRWRPPTRMRRSVARSRTPPTSTRRYTTLHTCTYSIMLSALAAADAHAPLCRALAHTADLHEKVHHTTHMYIQYHAVRAGGRRRACAALSRARAHRRPPREGTPHYTHVHTVSCCPRWRPPTRMRRSVARSRTPPTSTRRYTTLHTCTYSIMLSALAAADAHAPLCRALAHTADLHEKVHHTTHMYIQYHAVRAGGRRRACAALSRARAHRRPPREGTPHYTHVHTVSCCPRWRPPTRMRRSVARSRTPPTSTRRYTTLHTCTYSIMLSALAAADAHAPLCRALAHTADLHEKVHHTTHMYIQYHAVRAGGRRRACAALSRARAHRRPPREDRTTEARAIQHGLLRANRTHKGLPRPDRRH
ncbi:uncharacterized protein Snx1 isoform X1 [Plodia interpunctella]|uniref:uncharacterized protein Snx1 isoform X1 n=1 Tax=Plodia interpunctella TaxID=58824 RepID=UPI0023675F6A|nr:uncharacterized protein LOC128677533 isoform X1 [Plodia interpunctella]